MDQVDKRVVHENLLSRFVRGLAVCSAVISPLFLISFPFAFANVSIEVFTSPDDQFWTNSVIIQGAHEVMLVDAQLTKTSAEKVLQQIKETKKPLSTIYVPMRTPITFLVWRSLRRHIRESGSLRPLRWSIESTWSIKRK